jgi:hypothetical protein
MARSFQHKRVYGQGFFCALTFFLATGKGGAGKEEQKDGDGGRQNKNKEISSIANQLRDCDWALLVNTYVHPKVSIVLGVPSSCHSIDKGMVLECLTVSKILG